MKHTGKGGLRVVKSLMMVGYQYKNGISENISTVAFP
jgi:hypothetical protein